MQYFHFDSLIDKYSVDFTVISTSGGGYDDMGDWQPGETLKTPKRGAIIGISDTKMYRSEGMLTSKDRQLYMRESLGCDFAEASVIYDGNKYKVESQPNDNHVFTNVWAYTLKWISAFDGGDSTA